MGFGVYGSNGEVGRHSVALTDGPTIVVGRKGSFGEVHFSSEPCWPIDTTYYVDDEATTTDLRWLFHRMKALPLTELNRAAAVPGLNREDAYSQQLLLPPIEEQRRIAAVLDAADALRAKRRQALARLAALRDAIVAHDLAEYRERSTLGDHLVFVTSGSRGWARYYSESGRRFIRTQDVLLGSIDDEGPAFVTPPDTAESRRTEIRSGDLLVTITGIVGRVAAASAELDGAFISQHVAIARPSRSLRAQFAEAFMCSAAGQRQLDRLQYGQTKPGLNLSQIREFQLPVPSVEKQERLIAKLGVVHGQASRLRSSAATLDTLFASLQQRAFRGEL